jgi:hypothetical protein
MAILDWLRGPKLDATHQVAIQSPWAPTDPLVTFAMDEALAGALAASGVTTREVALTVPGVKRAHDILCSVAAGVPYFLMDGDTRVAADGQPAWLTNSASGVSPYHRAWGIASDQYMTGWAAVGFTSDRTDCLHIPMGMWGMDDKNRPQAVKGAPIPSEYTDYLVAIPLGYGSNGLLVDGARAVQQARYVEDAYQHRIENPVALTIMTIAGERYDAMDKAKRRTLRDEWAEGRKKSSLGMVPDYVKIDTAGQVSTDLYESARNASRLDLANHSGVPASLIEATRQGGGGGQDIRYSNDTSQRNELYDFGAAKYVRAFEARMSLDDVCAPGLSIRADLSALMASPSPDTNPTSED